jgi:thiol-disulfide isomerase/thioredoxin
VIALTIYSRPGCHLCDEMKAVVRRAAASVDAHITIEDIDISTDPDLEARYGLEIPVLLVNGKKAAKYRVSEQELARMLRDRAGGAGGAGRAGGAESG